MVTVKLSPTILMAWAEGKYEDAVAMYLGKGIPTTPVMELGKVTHQIWEMHVNNTGELPEELGGGQLSDPVVEQKYQKLFNYSDDIQLLLRGIPDCHEGTTIHEWKCGMTTATTYLDKMQLDYYKLLLPKMELGIYRCYNPYTHSKTVGVKFLNDTVAENALNHLMTNAGELIDYLQVNRLLIDYKGAGVGR